jgi:hypothetical protein
VKNVWCIAIRSTKRQPAACCERRPSLDRRRVPKGCLPSRGGYCCSSAPQYLEYHNTQAAKAAPATVSP